MNIGEVLKDWRLMEKMPLREAASRLGLSVPTLQRIENGKEMERKTMLRLIVFLFENPLESSASLETA